MLVADNILKFLEKNHSGGLTAIMNLVWFSVFYG